MPDHGMTDHCAAEQSGAERSLELLEEHPHECNII